MKNPDGSYRDGPAGALSLQAEALDTEGRATPVADRIAGPECERPEYISERKEDLEEALEIAREEGVRMELIAVATMVGVRPAELAEQYGVEVNTVHKWGERFRTLYRSEIAKRHGGDFGKASLADEREIEEVLR